MPDFLPSPALGLAFLGASLVLALTPGPAVVYILTRTLAQGRASGLASVAGVALGNLGNALGAALGLAALFAVSSTAFTIVKWAGAAYLVFLGLKMWRSEPGPTAAAASEPPPPTEPIPPGQPGRILREGFVVALLNPKTALFFAAFLPQFLRPEGSHLGQTLTLGAAFVLIAACTDLVYVLAASRLAPRMRSLAGSARWGRRLAGSAFIGLGIATALGGRSSRP